MTAKRNRLTARSTARYAIFALVLGFVWMPAPTEAASYAVQGRVYSATPLETGDEAPANPLTGTPAGQIVVDETTDVELVATVPRNLVNVRVLSADDGTELDSFVTRHEGAYLATFSAPSGGASVRFVIEELATSKQLLYSEPQTVPESVSLRFLLANEAPSEISDDRELAPSPAGTGSYTGIFTRVGKIELATEVGGTTQHLIDPTTGLADVPASVASDLAIPQYQDAPFGGNLYLFGALTQELYDTSVHPDVCYKIRIDPPSGSSTFLDDLLVKTKYTLDLTAGTVDTERVTLGPKTIGTVSDCYELTPLSKTLPSGLQVFWSYPDLLALWRTTGLDGLHELEIEIHNTTSGTFVPVSDFTDVSLRLDNVAPVARIQPLEPGDPDTPRVYTPGPPPPGPDLTATRVGNYPSQYGGTADPTCQILSLEPPTPKKYLAFKLTAHHPNSFMRRWHFAFQRNDGNGEVVLGKSYDGTTGDMADLPGVRVSSGESSTSGFQDRFLYLDTEHLEPSGMSLGGCAYRFVVRAWTRTTDGYHYLRRSGDQDLHYVQK